MKAAPRFKLTMWQKTKTSSNTKGTEAYGEFIIPMHANMIVARLSS